MSEESDKKYTDIKNYRIKSPGKHVRNRHPLKVSNNSLDRAV